MILIALAAAVSVGTGSAPCSERAGCSIANDSWRDAVNREAVKDPNAYCTGVWAAVMARDPSEDADRLDAYGVQCPRPKALTKAPKIKTIQPPYNQLWCGFSLDCGIMLTPGLAR